MNPIADLRQFARNQPLGLVIPASLVLAFAVNGLLNIFAEHVVMPFVYHAFQPDVAFARPPLSWTVAGITFKFAEIGQDGLVFVGVTLAAYALALRPLADDSISLPPRRCPECRSDVVVEATRCACCRCEMGASV